MNRAYEMEITPWAMHVYKLAAWDVDLYGADVVAAFGEYCGHQRRILAHVPRLRSSLKRVSAMVQFLMRSEKEARMDGWHPMDTAPRDGTKIRLLTIPDTLHGYVRDAQPFVGWWNPEGDSWADEAGQACKAGCGTIQAIGCWSCGEGWLQENEVSHWRALPQERMEAGQGIQRAFLPLPMFEVLRRGWLQARTEGVTPWQIFSKC